jgi:L-lactate dehydrogenase complex protein LldF
MRISSDQFRIKARAALADARLQDALARAKSGFIDKRRRAIEAFPEFGEACTAAKRIKDHVLAHLADYLEIFEQRAIESGGRVHWARTAEEACEKVIAICRAAGARTAIKGKSMASEEIDLNDALLAAGIEPIETDLGEYILQLAREPPSHIIAPAVHKTREMVAELFRRHHPVTAAPATPVEIQALVAEARHALRAKFLNAEIGITGANFLIAETGGNVLVTNEGNGDLCSTLPRVHIVVAGIEKIVPTLEDATTLLRVLDRSATGQELTAYTTFSCGPRRARDADGPEEYHVVLIDNGRTRILGGEFREMLRCIRCGACLNHCPVYGAVGGHAYGSVYPGPMGAVLTPVMAGLEQTYDLPNACTLNGRCEVVCPVQIPLPQLLRKLRFRQFRQGLASHTSRLALAFWAFCARRPQLYHALGRTAIRLLHRLGARHGRYRFLPFASAWTRARDFPAPQSRLSFLAQWQRLQDEH